MLPLYIWRGAPELADLFANVDLHAFDQGKLQIYHVIRLFPSPSRWQSSSSAITLGLRFSSLPSCRQNIVPDSFLKRWQA
jgi:hypothetical protein